jgi:hypothetical protein
MEQKAVEMEHKATLDLKVEELEERIAPGAISIGPVSGNHVHVNTHINHVDVL